MDIVLLVNDEAVGGVASLDHRQAAAGIQLYGFGALVEGVLLRPLGATVYWMPPYVIGEAEIDFLVDTVAKVLDAGSES